MFSFPVVEVSNDLHPAGWRRLSLNLQLQAGAAAGTANRGDGRTIYLRQQGTRRGSALHEHPAEKAFFFCGQPPVLDHVSSRRARPRAMTACAPLDRVPRAGGCSEAYVKARTHHFVSCSAEQRLGLACGDEDELS
jgi:hypothetical protein